MTRATINPRSRNGFARRGSAPTAALVAAPAITESASFHGPARAPLRHRGGYVYVFILSITLFITSVAMAVLVAARINGRVIVDANDSSKAEALAESAVEYGLYTLAADPNWRSDYPNALPIGPITLGDGTISFALVDDVDGNLTNNTYDSIRIYGTGRVLGATKVYSVRCTTLTPLDCLQTAAAFGGAVNLSDTMLAGSSPLLLASNTGIAATRVNFATTATLQSPTAGSTVATNFTGSAPLAAIGSRQIPDATSVFDYYKQLATQISISNLPLNNGVPTMQLAVLSPANNPYGSSTNPQGIYLVDCQHLPLQIQNMRIVGTLLILNPGVGSGVSQSNYLTPAAANFPVLMVDGDFSLDSTSSPLVDNPATGNSQIPSVNYNPVGTPYQNTADATYTTEFPSRMEGIVYISGSVTAGNSPTIIGALIAGGSFTQTGGTLNITPAAGPPAVAPPGFSSHVVTPISGSWQWESVH